jgi:predicted AAA+ superfamily ATPase
MEPWYKIVVPRKELREGRSLDPSEFAVHLDQIIDGTAPEEYRNSDKFFARTYFTEALGEHITKVLRRLNGETENTAPILSLITQFGGGKTHTLATLYHIVKSGEKARSNLEIAQILDKNSITKVPHA